MRNNFTRFCWYWAAWLLSVWWLPSTSLAAGYPTQWLAARAAAPGSGVAAAATSPGKHLAGAGTAPVVAGATPLAGVDAAVTSLYILGQLPASVGRQAVRAIITNTGSATLTNLPVTLTVSGALTFANVQTISSLAPGATSLVTFTAYNAPASLGTAAVTVSVPSDDNAANNARSQSQAITNGVFGYAAAGSTTATGTNFTNGTSPVVRAARYQSSEPVQVTALNNFIANATSTAGKVIYGVVMSAAGTVLARTPNYVIQSADLGTYKRLVFNTPAVVSGDFYLGLGGDLTAFPTAYLPESPVRPASFYVQGHLPAGGPISEVTNLDGLQLIEAVVATPPACASPATLLATNVTGTSAQLTFEAGAGNTSFNLTYQVQGSSTSTTLTAVSSPVTLTGLAPSTAYVATLTGLCGATSAQPPTQLVFGTSPPNDLCANALPLACGQTVTGTTFGSTSTGDPIGTVSGTAIYPASGGVFYRFTGTGAAVTLSMCSAASAYDAELFVLTGTCGNYALVAGDDDGCGAASGSTLTFSSVYGREYLVFVSGFGGDQGTFSLTATCAALPNLVVSTTQTVAGGTYNNVTITGPATGGTGRLTLLAPLQVVGALTVQNGGTLQTNCQLITGPGSFTLAAGGTLGICHPAGLAASGATGAVQVTGTRSFSPDASYLYNGTATQTTGSGLPSQVRNLSTTNANAVTLTQPVRVAQVVTVGAAGNLVLNGQALTLLSSSAGTALVVNSSTGVVSGNTATVQRYLDASGNTGGGGYRHYAAPVTGFTVGGLATTGRGGSFTPVVNPDYNAAALPGTTVPYPSVYGYDESRLATSLATGLSDFDKGYYSPAALSEVLAPGQGYTVQIGNDERVDFTGTLVTGPQTLSGLTRGDNAEAGWQLVGNPYPAPLDWGTVGAANTGGSGLTGLDAAAYVFQSTGPYIGRYASFVNNVGVGSGQLAVGQGFFVRTSTPGVPGTLRLTNANRVTSYGTTQPAFQRLAADSRPLLRLSLRHADAVQDETFVYYEQGATAGFDGQFDAYKLVNPNGYYLATTAQVPAGATARPLSISGRAPLLASQGEEVIPVWLSTPAGTYSLTATELLHFDTLAGGTQVYLRDGLTGTLTDLNQTASYTFDVAAGDAYAGRFSLVLRPSAPLATTPSAATQPLATLYPNPVEAGQLTLAVTGLPATTRTVEATIVSSLGQVVGRHTLAASPGTARATVSTAALAAGVYVVRLRLLDAQGQSLDTLPTQRLSVR